ncbi:MAG: hypothetical protein IPL60_12235 [Ardenticatenia bacterium]|nr:hypothetical protein [Ardenticatenia bacterium]
MTQLASESQNGDGNHFIVLIDDSSDMGDATRRQQLAAAIPKYLFGELGDQREDYPAFNPVSDELTVLFFAGYGSNPGDRGGCFPDKRSSIAPNNLFDMVTADRQFSGAQDLQDFLAAQLADKCRFKGYLSPIVVAELLALPYVQGKLDPDRLFRRTLLLLASNLRYNLTASPAGELSALTQVARQENQAFDAKETADAMALARRVSQEFNMEVPSLAYIPVDRNGDLVPTAESASVWLHPIEIKPASNQGFWYPKVVEYDREAISQEAIRLVPASGIPAELRIPVSSILNPVQLHRKFTADEGTPARIGDQVIGLPAEIDLRKCQEGLCRREDDAVYVPLLDTTRLTLTAKDVDTIAGTVDMSPIYRYGSSDVYDHLLVGGTVSGTTYSISVRTTSPDKVEANQTLPSLFPALKIDNATLLGAWRPNDTGLRQTEARARLTAQREVTVKRIGIALLVLVMLVVAAMFIYFYRTSFRRPFHPHLVWLPARDVVIDFNRPGASRMLVATVGIENSGTVPWFGQLFGHKSQPEVTADMALTIDAMESHGLALCRIGTASTANGIVPVGFMPSLFDPRIGILSEEISSAGESDVTADDSSRHEEALTLSLRDSVFHGKQFFVLLASDTIADYQTPPSGAIGGNDSRSEWKGGDREGSGDVSAGLLDRSGHLIVPVTAKMCWSDQISGAHRDLVESYEFKIDVRPEDPRAPRIEFRQASADGADGRHYFAQDSRQVIGRFSLCSSANHGYAHAFVGEYSIQANCDGRPANQAAIQLQLAGSPESLASVISATIPPRDIIDLEVVLVCDGENVKNPWPASEAYTFQLIGPSEFGSEMGPKSVDVYRDPSRSEIQLFLEFQRRRWEIFWQDERPVYREIGEGDRVVGEYVLNKLAGSTSDSYELLLPARRIGFRRDTPPTTLFTLRVGNSARSGRGVVTVESKANLRIEASADSTMPTPDSLEMRTGAKGRLLDAVGIYVGENKEPEVTVHEGESPEERTVRIDTQNIERITTGRIPEDVCHVDVDMKILVRDDHGTETRRHLICRLPLTLEELPGPNWLCIDFGTSAIAVASGQDRVDFAVLPLQGMAPERGINFNYGSLDPENQEALRLTGGRREFARLLPSWLICDADWRMSGGVPDRPAGYPGSGRYSLKPGEAGFVSLPATSKQLFGVDPEEAPGRIIYSLKSWIGMSSDWIKLEGRIEFENKHGERESSHLVPLDETVESGLRALNDAYLNQRMVTGSSSVQQVTGAHRIVMTCPNTFTPNQRDRLREIVFQAFKSDVLPLRDRIQLMSESDAVAVYYCLERSARPVGIERILVYDFGAGTLDCSLITVDWAVKTYHPESWIVEARTGVPVAGNHLDSIIARISHDMLEELVPVLEECGYAYGCPLTSASPIPGVRSVDLLGRYQECKTPMGRHFGLRSQGWRSGGARGWGRR